MENQLFEIKHRTTGEVIFSLECKSLKICVEAAVKSKTSLNGAYLNRAYLNGAYLDGAYLDGASLNGAYLDGAYLDGAYLDGAYLDGAYLDGASLNGANGEEITIKYTPLQISGLRWNIIIFDKDMKIGCEYHSISDWFSFDDTIISKMNCDALNFWKANKQAIMSICAANGRE